MIPPGLKVLSLSVPAFMASAFPATYFVASNGSDANTGTSVEAPFQSINRALSIAVSGDECMVRGGEYREMLRFKNSGTPGSPITLKPFQKEKVTITGLETIRGWSVFDSAKNILRAPVESGKNVTGLYFNRVSAVVSAWPNLDPGNWKFAFAGIDSGSLLEKKNVFSVVKSCSDSLPGKSIADYWVGAKIWANTGVMYHGNTSVVIAQEGTCLTYKWDLQDYYTPIKPKIPIDRNLYYLRHGLKTLDAPNEWWVTEEEAAAKFVYYIPPAGRRIDAGTIEIRTRKSGLDLGTRSHILVDGLDFFAATVDFSESRNCIVRNCRVLYPIEYHQGYRYDHPTGVRVTGSANTLENSEIAFSWVDGVYVTGADHRIANNLIHDIDWSGFNGAGIYCHDTPGTEGASAYGTGYIITRNTIYNCGRTGIEISFTRNSTVTYNDVSGFGKLTRDLGGINAHQVYDANTDIAYNRIHSASTYGIYGIYIDDAGNDYRIHHNVIYNLGNASVEVAGLRINLDAGSHSRDIVVFNNTISVKTAIIVGRQGKGLLNARFFNNALTQSSIPSNSSDALWKGAYIDTATHLENCPPTRFVDPARGDFRPKQGSLLIDRGTTRFGYTGRYGGGAPDIGAYEYGRNWTAGSDVKAAAK
jgi:parallel beta helix pectate lyase-like protein